MLAEWKTLSSISLLSLLIKLINLSRRSGDYVAQFVYMLQPTADVQQFMKAWETIVKAAPILRTRIIDVPGYGLMQTMISQPAKWTRLGDTITLHTYRRADHELATGLGTPLTRYTVLRTPEDGSRYFVWTIHHALYDSWSISLILERLEGFVAPLTPPPPFQSFVKHITDIDKSAAAKYWEQQFQGLEAQVFPQLPSNTYQPLSTASIKRRLHVPHWPDTGITPSSVLRAAWSLLASKYADGTEVIFGVTVAGRQAAVTDVERMMGPTIATVPVRITLDWSQMTVEQLLRQVQAQSVGVIAYEQMGLQCIRRISPEADRACQFQTLLVVHASEEDDPRHQCTSSRWFISKRDEDGWDDTHVTVADTHALALECDLQRYGLRLRAAHDTNVIDADRVQRLAVQFEHVIQQLCASNNASKCLSRLNMLCEQDTHDIWSRNAVLPEADDSCLHDLVTKTAGNQPQAMAINAWDGDYTYEKFEELSSLLARQVDRNTIVPLHFRKSKRAPVAMLGVMKAGGASVMMDSRQPPERMRSVLDQIKPAVFITSAGDEKFVSSLSGTPTIVLNDKLMREIASSVVAAAILPQVQPSDRLYLIFTSGSTGTPKGAQISHSNVCSALRYQRQAHGYTSDARVYDFGSYAFDSVWVNFMSTFTIGGCLCIPSERERSDDLAASIKRFNPTILDVTPSAATVLDDSTIASLRTLILGGERLTSEYAERWSRLVDIRLSYGPCECTPTATIATIYPNHEGEPNIGHGTGCLTWITDTEEGKTLVPIGTIGELVLEGPLVGLGYLGDEAKTAAAFIKRPPWLSAVRQDRRGPFYRTGDLVKYNLDGTLMFIGRKDAQIKIHGQRVELAEIEGYMARHIRTRHVVQHIHDLEALLREYLPPYMVPSTWVPLKDLPLNASGKLNRHLLEDWLCHLDWHTIAKIDTMSHPPTTVEPQTHKQHILRNACGDILNSTPAKIDIQRSFVANGGDSISAMRLSSYCRTLGLTLSVSSLLKGKSLIIVADPASMDAPTPVLTHVEVLDKAFSLSPIQRWFFDQAPLEEHLNERHHYNQGFYVKMSRFVSPQRLSVAMHKIVQHHSMLRVRFTTSRGGWTQSAPRVEDAVYNFSSVDAQSLSEITSNAIELHRSLNFEHGPVLATALYHLTPENVQYLILVAHHLVVDLVSWRIIMDDLEALLSDKELIHSTPFQVWTQLQAEEVRDNLDFWNFNERTSNTTHDHIMKTFEADLATTSLLLKDSNIAFNSEPVDIILAAVWDAFFRSFPERTGLTIFNEGHGREPLTDTAIDLSRTVGWFTSLSPLHVDRSVDDSAVHTVRLVKDARRRLPTNGLAYWVSRFLNPDGIKAFESHSSPMEVQFNYLGQFQQLERADSLFTAINLDAAVPATSPHMPTSVLFDINVIIEAGVAKFCFAWNRHIDHQDSILAWIAQIVPSLQSLCYELRGRPTSRTFAFDSAVLCSHRGNILLVESESYEGALDTVKHLPRVDYTQPRPPHRITLCSISGQPHILCQIEISHAICDGASTAITIKDWVKAYSGELDVRELQDVTRDFTLDLAAHSRVESTAYWKDKLSGMEPCIFPHLRAHTPAISSQPNGVTSLEIRSETLKLVERFCKLQAVTLASFFQSAWTFVSAYVASNRICFGYLASGRQLPVKGIDQSIGAYANVMICRADLSRQHDEKGFVHYIYEQVLEDMGFQHCSVAEIQHELGLPSLFNTIMSFQKEEDCVGEQDPEHQELNFIEVDWRDPTEYDITININQSKIAVRVTAEYRLACIDSEQARRVISLLESTIISLVTETVGPSTATHRTLPELTATQSASVDDLRDVWNWNKIVPETVDKLVHHTIADVARRIPRAPAICAWDGEFTYRELEAAANKLAQHLVSLGVGPKVIVPLCFEKSKWMSVSMFAVMKAGAASLAIDCTLPRERLRSIMQQVHPLVVLVSIAQTELAKQLTDRPMPAVEMPEVKPLDQLYIVFTSGSTGVPKGVATTHSNFSSAIQHQQTSMGFKSTSWVYNFVKYAFDVTWSNFLHTMTSGGCLCIPSETEAIDNLADSFLKYRANFIDLTPSVASTIRPADLPALNHLLFSGEVLPTHIGAQWAERAIVLNTYGPAECSVKATFARISETEAQVANIGRGFGLCTWIVQPINHPKLVPVGVVGELLLEGPLIGTGYLGDVSRMQTAFLENPPWLVRGLPHDASSGAPSHPGRYGRLYKTGDLVRYESVGTMTFVGRNNAQVKINGQRVELGDVEYHVRNNIAIADMQVQVYTSILMVFVHVVNEQRADDSAIDRTGQSAMILTGLNERLAAHVPAHMIPSAYLVLKELPMTTTGKADRRRLREIGEKLTFEQIMALSSGSDGGQQPCTATERQLRNLWAQVLSIKTSDTIKVDHNFFQIGGDSIRAMKLVGLARKVGLHLSVSSIFKQPILKDMARSTGQVSGLDEDDIPPFSLLITRKDARKLLEQAAELGQVDIARIEDIFPCTPLQEGLLALTAKRAGDYTAQYIIPLQRSVDLVRFKRAWEEVLRTTPTLRSRIVDLAYQGLVQVILDHNVQWSHYFSVSEYREVDEKAEIGLGKQLVRYATISENNQSRTHCFAWTIHHALYDGSSMRLIMGRLNQAYQDTFALQPAPPFSRFVRHILNIEEGDANSFWQAQFAGLEAQVFPKLPSAMYQPRAESYVIHYIKNVTWPRSSITAATAIRSSWSILTVRLTNSSDVIFGVTMNGRQAAVYQIDEMTGPTLTTLPVRTIFDWEQSVEAYLDQVQREMTEMIPYEQTGLQNTSRINNECRQACNFQSLLLIHPFEETKDLASLLFVAHNNDDPEEVASRDFATYALTLECELEEHGLKLKFEYDDGVIGSIRVSNLADQFEHILRQLCDSSNSTKRIAEIEAVSKTELDIIWTWNAKTYAEVHDMSTRLAHHLVHLGVGCETVVPLCFEKSKWTPIAMLAVMKAGGTCVTLDPALPQDRLFKIVHQIKPSIILSSSTNRNLSSRLCEWKPVIVVNDKLQALFDKQTSKLPRIQHALASLFEQFDMLRMVVIPYKNMFLQIVLRHVSSGSTVFEIAADSLDEYTLHLKNRDLLSDLHFGDVVTKIFIVRQTRDQRYRIVVRLSHAQYDGIALEKMWTAFEDSYNSSVCVNGAIPAFPTFVTYTVY
ncbi:acetyl-CoA synthetase-like protein [Lindgomyces ingoldianus]|uniref:Acetyl-CoA synthetase-like protein n=1 Tax=Lindgomyces ingoldianus TaxID=673940 RepID=A0ACB6QN00_9PLEO|nr:acetyl-CoA synthetase-like protein [Lindgomyces ingoldianus]KAF2468358.1 acetyl-CoA synthetase-like protein [Lindgomyces ingoldianus]